jgi:hypothetical protein
METPKTINFKALADQVKTEIQLLENFIVLKAEEVNMLIDEKSKLVILTSVSDSKQALSKNQKEQQIIEKKLGIQELMTELEIKKQALYEYEIRALEYEEKLRYDHLDFIKNFDSVYQKAVEYSQSKELLPDLKKHLNFVLSVDTKRFDTERKITWYLSLKTEIKMCENYFNFKDIHSL